MKYFLVKNVKKIFVCVLVVVTVFRIHHTYLNIQPTEQEIILQEMKDTQLEQTQFVIKEKVLVNRKQVYKIVVSSTSDNFAGQKYLLLNVVGECVCDVRQIIKLTSHASSTIKTIDSYIQSRQINFNKDSHKQSQVSFMSPTARYKREGIFFVITASSGDLMVVGTQEEGIVDVLASIKNTFVKQVQTHIPFPYAELGHGLIISGKSALPKDIEEDFKRSGLMHIVVLSGFNVSIVIQFVFSLFAFGPKIFRFSVGTLFVVLFVLMAGVSSALLRATLMALIALLCSLYKKEIDGLALLAIVGMLLVIIDPMSFYFDLSFWLSILATFGLISLSGFFQTKLSFIPEKAGLREAGASSLATQVTVTPLLMLINPDISILSFFANILILPIVPLTMALVFVTGVLGFITSFAATFFGHVSYLLLSYIISVTHLVSQLPFATMTFEQNSFSPLFYFIFIVPLSIWLYKKKKP